MIKQLEIPVAIERHDGDRYAEKKAEYLRNKDNKLYHPVFFCYCGQPASKKFFVSYFFKREIVEAFNFIKIIEDEQ